MRADIAVNDVLLKCEVLKRAGLWLPEPRMRPRRWIKNFDESDRPIAAALLDRFTFYNASLTDRLLMASYDSIGDGMPKGPSSPPRLTLLAACKDALWTPVRGETPNPTDSGNLLCRRARQVLGIPETQIVEQEAALSHAAHSGAVIFVDDLVGSGEQFLKTWTRDLGGATFESIQSQTEFTAIYVTLIAAAHGLQRIHARAPNVAICAAHVLEQKSTVHGYMTSNPKVSPQGISTFLAKYSQRLVPKEKYIAQNPSFLNFGFGELGLMFGFDHSIPDATLPVFWAPGSGSWEPLIERA